MTLVRDLPVGSITQPWYALQDQWLGITDHSVNLDSQLAPFITCPQSQADSEQKDFHHM